MEAMAKLCLDGDKDKSASYVAVCSSCLEPSTTLSVFLTLRYLNVCPDKLEEFCGHSDEVMYVLNCQTTCHADVSVWIAYKPILHVWWSGLQYFGL